MATKEISETNSLIDDFTQFIAEVHPGRTPYQWQLRLLETIISNGAWPKLIKAPTGAGKTNVIDIHVFLNAMAGSMIGALPRRLILVVGRRALVDSQFQYAQELRESIFTLQGDQNTVASRVYLGLGRRAGLDTSGPSGLQDAAILPIANIRGGGTDTMAVRRWQIDPLACSIFCMTPDMFGSRLLFGGYGVSKSGRPVAASLLSMDSVAVIDEAHLNRQLLFTAGRIPELDSFALSSLPLPRLQVVASTATPTQDQDQSNDIQHSPGVVRSGADIVEVTEDDLKTDTQLADRLTKPKLFTLNTVDGKPGDKKFVQTVLDLCMELDEDSDGTRPVGVIVNSPKTATVISQALKTQYGVEAVATIVGRMRPYDRDRYIIDEAGVIRVRSSETEANHLVHFVVATQTLEVGVDIDLAALVTEIAPASALAQRAGRVNRMGLRDQGPIGIVIPELDEKSEHTGIYRTADLRSCLLWLEDLPDHDLSAWNIKRNPPAEASLRRRTLQRPEWADAEFWSNTSENTAASQPLIGAAANLDLWLRDGLEGSVEISLAVRELPRQEHLALRMLELAPIDQREIMQVRIKAGRDALLNYLQSGSDEKPARVFRINADGDVERLSEVVTRGTSSLLLNPGDIVVVDDYAPLFTDMVLMPDGRDTLADVSPGYVGDSQTIFTAVAQIGPRNEMAASEHQDVLGITSQEWEDLGAAFAFVEDQDSSIPESEPEEKFLLWLKGRAASSGASLKMFVEHATGSSEVDGLIADVSAENDELMLILRSPQGTPLGESEREIFTPRNALVLLDDHQREVGSRVRALAEALELPDWVQDVLEQAGLLHDEGKRDARFQELLRLGDRKAKNETAALAKSRFRSVARERQFRSLNGLNSWRHEQLSAAYAYLQGGEHSELLTRLVGTTHGFGRGTFDDGAKRLIPRSELLDVYPSQSSTQIDVKNIWDAAAKLFDEGMWEVIVENTNRDYGHWGVSFLESLLRLADSQVSSEGR